MEAVEPHGASSTCACPCPTDSFAGPSMGPPYNRASLLLKVGSGRLKRDSGFETQGFHRTTGAFTLTGSAWASSHPVSWLECLADFAPGIQRNQRARPGGVGDRGRRSDRRRGDQLGDFLGRSVTSRRVHGGVGPRPCLRCSTSGTDEWALEKVSHPGGALTGNRGVLPGAAAALAAAADPGRAHGNVGSPENRMRRLLRVTRSASAMALPASRRPCGPSKPRDRGPRRLTSAATRPRSDEGLPEDPVSP